MNEEYLSRETKEKDIMNMLYSLVNNYAIIIHSKMALYLQTRFFSWEGGTKDAGIGYLPVDDDSSADQNSQ